MCETEKEREILHLKWICPKIEHTTTRKMVWTGCGALCVNVTWVQAARIVRAMTFTVSQQRASCVYHMHDTNRDIALVFERALIHSVVLSSKRSITKPARLCVHQQNSVYFVWVFLSIWNPVLLFFEQFRYHRLKFKFPSHLQFLTKENAVFEAALIEHYTIRRRISSQNQRQLVK